MPRSRRLAWSTEADRYPTWVIVVIGDIGAAGSVGEVSPAGMTGAVALAAATAGARVELVARVGDDPVGDGLLLAIAAAGVGHVATLRDASRQTPITGVDDEPVDLDDDAPPPAPPVDAPTPTLDGADVSLALRYLPEYRVVIAVHPSPAVLAETVAAARWAGAHLVVALDPAMDGPAPADLPADALVLAVAGDAVGLGDALGRYAAAVDRGDDPAAAFAATLGAVETASVEP
jgi:sugar/nucleoside kinase (ribokinase family)